jgi:hypothetical protein
MDLLMDCFEAVAPKGFLVLLPDSTYGSYLKTCCLFCYILWWLFVISNLIDKVASYVLVLGTLFITVDVSGLSSQQYTWQSSWV